jgi:hypothetical protein
VVQRKGSGVATGSTAFTAPEPAYGPIGLPHDASSGASAISQSGNKRARRRAPRYRPSDNDCTIGDKLKAAATRERHFTQQAAAEKSIRTQSRICGLTFSRE